MSRDASDLVASVHPRAQRLLWVAVALAMLGPIGCSSDDDSAAVVDAARAFYTAYLGRFEVGTMRATDWETLTATTEPKLLRELRAGAAAIAPMRHGACELKDRRARELTNGTWVVPAVWRCESGATVGLGFAFRRTGGKWRVWETRDRRSAEERARSTSY